MTPPSVQFVVLATIVYSYAADPELASCSSSSGIAACCMFLLNEFAFFSGGRFFAGVTLTFSLFFLFSRFYRKGELSNCLAVGLYSFLGDRHCKIN